MKTLFTISTKAPVSITVAAAVFFNALLFAAAGAQPNPQAAAVPTSMSATANTAVGVGRFYVLQGNSK